MAKRRIHAELLMNEPIYASLFNVLLLPKDLRPCNGRLQNLKVSHTIAIQRSRTQKTNSNECLLIAMDELKASASGNLSNAKVGWDF